MKLEIIIIIIATAMCLLSCSHLLSRQICPHSCWIHHNLWPQPRESSSINRLWRCLNTVYSSPKAKPSSRTSSRTSTTSTARTGREMKRTVRRMKRRRERGGSTVFPHRTAGRASMSRQPLTAVCVTIHFTEEEKGEHVRALHWASDCL